MREHRQTLALEEYRALRATIRERGSLRFLVTLITFVSWAIAAMGALALAGGPLASLLALAVLAAGFEVGFAIHVGVERIGRYIQVRFEATTPADSPWWEHAIMEIGRMPPAPGGPQPLFAPLFVVAATLNVAALLTGASATLVADLPSIAGVSGAIALHAAFMWRLRQAIRFASGQRAVDLAAFSSGPSQASIR